MTKTSKILSIDQENTCKSSLDLNLTILTDFHSVTVNQDKLQNKYNFKISAKVPVCDYGEKMTMTKTS